MSSVSATVSDCSGCRVRMRRCSMMARATGWWNSRSGSVTRSGADFVLCPAASVAVSTMSAACPAQACGVRSW